MGLFKIWKDHVTQYSNRYREVQNADGTITHEAVEGEVVQEGTPQNAQNFNDLEERILSAGLIANLAMLKLGAAEGRIKGLQGEIVEATLDICKDTQDGLTVGVNTEAREYVAQVIIPAREYEIVDTGEKDEDGKAITKREPVPFDMKKCTLVLWALI